MDTITCGVYAIRNKKDGRLYIGSSAVLTRRWKEHRRDLRLCRHFNQYLQNAWNAHGEECFEWMILEECSREHLLEREDWWIKQSGSLYNLGGPIRGVTSEETRAKRSARLKGKRVLPEGFRHSAETRAKMSAARKGKRVLPEGYQFSAEECAKRSERMKGRPGAMKGRTHSAETRAKIAAAAVGRVISDGQRAKMSANRRNQPAPFTGRKHSEETKQRMREAQRHRFDTQPVTEETREKLRAAQARLRAARQDAK